MKLLHYSITILQFLTICLCVTIDGGRRTSEEDFGGEMGSRRGEPSRLTQQRHLSEGQNVGRYTDRGHDGAFIGRNNRQEEGFVGRRRVGGEHYDTDSRQVGGRRDDIHHTERKFGESFLGSRRSSDVHHGEHDRHFDDGRTGAFVAKERQEHRQHHQRDKVYKIDQVSNHTTIIDSRKNDHKDKWNTNKRLEVHDVHRAHDASKNDYNIQERGPDCAGKQIIININHECCPENQKGTFIHRIKIKPKNECTKNCLNATHAYGWVPHHNQQPLYQQLGYQQQVQQQNYQQQQQKQQNYQQQMYQPVAW